MSISNDDDFAREVIEQTAKMVAKQKAEFMNQLHAERCARGTLEKKVSELTEKCTALETRLKVLETEKPAHKCGEVLGKIFTAGLLEVVQLGQNVPNAPVTEDGMLNVTPNPELSEPTPGPSGVKRKNEEDGKRKRKGKTSVVTPPLVQTLDQVPSPLRESLTPFMEKGINDYLNDIQRALVVYRTHTSMHNGEKIGDAFIHAVIADGIENNLWHKDFNPSDKDTFFLYLKDKVHNIRRKINNRQSLENQQDFVDKYVHDYMAGERWRLLETWNRHLK